MKRTILISGASRGIGNAIAISALNSGHRLSLGLRNINSVKGTVLDPEISGSEKIMLQNYEATNENSTKEWLTNTIQKFGNLDTLINCAGIFNRVGFLYEEGEEKEIDKLWKVNVMGPWLLTKEAWPHLSKSKKGRIIVLVSMSGKRSKGNLAGYSMSKFALMSLCQTMRNLGWEKGIRVTAICPSWVNTEMADGIKSIVPPEMMTQPEDIGNICTNLLNLPTTCIPFEMQVNCSLEI